MNKAIYQTMDRYLSRKSSRRDFIQAVTALGVTSLAAESLLASVQEGGSDTRLEGQAVRSWNSEGMAGALLVEQLKAAGVKYIFHTNTSGLDTLSDAVDLSGMQIIMVTHEGQAVSVAQGYALASGELGFFMGSKVGVGNSLSNLYNAWKDRTPLIVSYGRSTLRGQGGQDGFEEWDDHLKPHRAFYGLGLELCGCRGHAPDPASRHEVRLHTSRGAGDLGFSSRSVEEKGPSSHL